MTVIRRVGADRQRSSHVRLRARVRRYLAQNLDVRFELSDEDMTALLALEMPFRYGGLERDKAHPLWPFKEPF